VERQLYSGYVYIGDNPWGNYGDPVKNGELFLFKGFKLYRGIIINKYFTSTYTNEQGYYEFKNIPAGIKNWLGQDIKWSISTKSCIWDNEWWLGGYGPFTIPSSGKYVLEDIYVDWVGRDIQHSQQITQGSQSL